MYRKVLPACLTFLVVVTFSISNWSLLIAQDAKRVFRAGAATSNITPPLGESIVGGWKPYPATQIHDELYARCLVLDDGKVKVGIVLCDNVGIPREVFEQAKNQVREATGLPSSHLLMAATHTHSATTARGSSKMIEQSGLREYQKFLANRISDGVRRALAQLEPARIGLGSVDEPSEVFNRLIPRSLFSRCRVSTGVPSRCWQTTRCTTWVGSVPARYPRITLDTLQSSLKASLGRRIRHRHSSECSRTGPVATSTISISARRIRGGHPMRKCRRSLKKLPVVFMKRISASSFRIGFRCPRPNRSCCFG